MAPPAHPLVDALTRAAARYADGDRAEKIRLLDLLAATRLPSPRDLRVFHETLCFLQAYPDDHAVLSRADAALDGFAARVAALGAHGARALSDSGIEGTVLEYPFGLPMARWLTERFPDRAEIVWRKLADPDRLQDALALLIHPSEYDAFADEGGLGWRRWLAVAKGGRRQSDLQAIVALFDQADLDDTARDWLFESLGLTIGWRLGGPSGSRTRARMDVMRGRLEPSGRDSLRRLDEEAFGREVARPLRLRKAPRALADALIDAARLAMATRLRELFAFSYANPDDVLLADPEGGLRIALVGILPPFRLPFEGYYAYLALEHGVPVGYGAAWQLAGSLELAVNVFESYRRGESALIVSQVMRAYHALFGAEPVYIDPYQIGKDNHEALAAGAFYFYYYLGFVPRHPDVRRIALAEREKIARDPAHRSPLPVLRQLARSEMVRPRAPGDAAAERPITAAKLAALVTADIARRFAGDRRAAERAAAASVARTLGAGRMADWPREERRAFERLALLVGLIPDLARWPAAERRRLVHVMRAKGGQSEARYVRLLGAHRRLVASLRALAGTAQERGTDGTDTRSLTGVRAAPRSQVNEMRPSGSKRSAVMASSSRSAGAQSRSMRATSRPE